MSINTALDKRTEADQRFLALYQQLNPQQKEAVDHLDGPLMVLAGPGTGKTQLVAMRIAKILRETQMDPWNILCVTFTESGVQAMRDRLRSIIGTPAYYVRIHTFHSFCNEIIQEQPEYFGTAQQWQPISDIERIELTEALLESLPGTSPLRPLGAPYLYVRDVMSIIQSLKQEAIAPDQFAVTVDSLQTFVAETEQPLLRFHAMKPKERTEQQCEEFNKLLLVAAQRARLPTSMIAVPERLFANYLDRLAEVEDGREASKRRTGYKSEVKRWHNRLQRQLPRHRDLALLYERYQGSLQERGRYDFEDMITFVLQALASHDDLLAHYQEQFQYIMVDEFQDTNGAQNELIRLLGSFDAKPNIGVVGDDKQSIFRFQGASMSNMLDFYHRHAEDVRVVSLKENYRSQSQILAAAGSLIAHNRESITKYLPGTTHELMAKAPLEPRPVRLVECASEDSEDFWVAQQIKELLASGVAPSSIAVLVRYHRDSERLFGILRRLQVPARLEAGENVLADTVITQFLTLLRAIDKPNQDDLLGEVLHYSWLGLDTIDGLTLLHVARQERRSVMSLVTDVERLKGLSLRQPSKWLAWAEKMAAWHRHSKTTTLIDFLQMVATESGYLDFLLQHTDHLAGLQKITRLMEEARRLNQQVRQLTVDQFLAALDRLSEHRLSLTTQPWQMADEAVRIMTAHKAKGLEFDHVFITRLNDRHWGNNPEPQKLSLPHGLVRYDYLVAKENNEDERRLFYVALTRARQELVLVRSRHNHQGRETVPSLFWSELPEASTHLQVEAGETPQDTVDRLAVQITPVPSVQRDEIEAWVKQQLATYVMSVTHLNDFLTCQRLFYLRHILKLPRARTSAQALGTAVHNSLRDFFSDFTSTNDVPPLSVLQHAFSRHLDFEVLTTQAAAQIREIGQSLLTDYYARYKDELVPAVATEYSFASHGIVVDGIAITGKIDKIEMVDAATKTVNVVDFKTSSPAGAASKLKATGAYHRQLVFYQLLCDTSPRFDYHMVSGEIDFLHPDDQGHHIKKRLVITTDDVAALKETMAQVWEQIQTLSFMDRDAGCGDCTACAVPIL